MTERQLYTVNEFLRRNSIGRTLFYRLVGNGDITVVKVGTKTLVPAISEKNWHSTLTGKVSAQPHKIPHKDSGDCGEPPGTAVNKKAAINAVK